jgi:hypothetical protein
MRKIILVLATMGLAVLLAAGVALALDTVECTAATSCQGTGDDDVLIGTTSPDVIIPYGGDDTVYAGDDDDEVRHSFGNDLIKGGPGKDTLRGGFGNDTIYGGPGKDLIDCAYKVQRSKGEAYDVAYASSGDTVVDCQTVNWNDPTDPQDPSDPTYPTWPTYVPGG